MRERREPSAAPPPAQRPGQQPGRQPGRPDRTSVPIRDEVALALAEFAVGRPRDPDPALAEAATRVVVDSLAVALGAFAHPAAATARRYAGILAADGPWDGPCTLWGTDRRAGPETAALVNGVPLRGYDFNDLYMGRGTDGHPSDIVPGLIAVAEWRGASGADFLDALAVGYEIILDCCDCLAVDKAGWDYVNLTAIGGTAAIARLMGLDAEQTAHALGITVTAHAASAEVESGDLDKRGDLTMWKRFNGADANRHSVYACLLAAAGAEGAVRPFTGENGFLNRVNATAGGGADLLDRLRTKAGLGRIREVTFKRWPVGSRGQSAIRAALAARAQIGDPGTAKAVRVATDAGAYRHLVAIRDDPWNPVSRETADHSLPYIVAVAFLDGEVTTGSFEPSRVMDPALRRFLRDRVSVVADDGLTLGSAGGFPTRVTVETDDGRCFVGDAIAPPGHPSNPFSADDLAAKFREYVPALYGPERAEDILATVLRLDRLDDMRTLTALLAGSVRDG